MEILGILSALLALVAFVCNQYGIWRNDNFWYDLFNFLSGVGLVIYAVSIGGVPFILTNSVWALVSGIDVARSLWKKARGAKKPA